MQFEMDSIIIDENGDYQDVESAINEFNKTIKKEEHKYIYRGQTPHGLAYEYYTNNYDKQILSKCSPQIYDILISKLSMNSPLLEFYKSKGEIAFDINKQYTNILMNCDKFGWAVYMPTDEVKIFDGRIDTGRYYIETDENFMLGGNGWYADIVVEKAVNYGVIDLEDIKLQIKSSIVLKSNHFEDFVLKIYDKMIDGKKAINGFIGLLGQSTCKNNKHYYETNYDVIANELINNENNIEITGIYQKNNNETTCINLLNLDENELNNVINENINNTEEPILYHLNMKSELSMYENTLPIHRKIYDVARLEIYELHKQV